MTSSSERVLEGNGVVQAFKEKHEGLLRDFESLGWTLPDDPDLAEFAVLAFEQFQEELPVFEKAVAQSARAKKDPWIRQTSPWETGMTVEDVSKQRTEFMACAMRKDVSEEYLSDCQKRWAAGDFTESSEKYLVVGDLYCQKLAPVPVKLEVDEDAEFASKGRKDVTYQLWEGGKLMEKISFVRPKINGERFVLIYRDGKKILKGFKEYELLPEPGGIVPKLVEYYAGSYYCIEPPISVGLSIPVRYPGGTKEISLRLKGHPWMTIQEYLSQPQYLNSHKYDGIMMQVGEEELRAKWVPTGESEINGSTWELTVFPQPVLCRPRQGKKASQMSTLVSGLRARFRGLFLVESLRSGLIPGPVVQPPVQQADVMHIGAKAVVLTHLPEKRGQAAAVFIRENSKKGIKPLDLLGGSVELGESPIEAMIREMFEETDWKTTADMYVEIGTSEGSDVKGKWKSHLFMIYMPWTEVSKRKDLETYTFDTEYPSVFPLSSRGNPKQDWLGRNWLAALERMPVQPSHQPQMNTFLAYYQMTVAKDSVYPIALVEMGSQSESMMSAVREIYTAKILAYGRKLRQVDPLMQVEPMYALMKKSWFFDVVLSREFNDTFSNWGTEQLLTYFSSQELSKLRPLLVTLFKENARKNSQTSLNPFHLRSILRSWGYEGSDKSIKKMIQHAISENIIGVSNQSNSWGGMVYRLK